MTREYRNFTRQEKIKAVKMVLIDKKSQIEVERTVTTDEPQMEVDDSLKPDFILQYEQVQRENPNSVVLLFNGGFFMGNFININ